MARSPFIDPYKGATQTPEFQETMRPVHEIMNAIDAMALNFTPGFTSPMGVGGAFGKANKKYSKKFTGKFDDFVENFSEPDAVEFALRNQKHKPMIDWLREGQEHFTQKSAKAKDMWSRGVRDNSLLDEMMENSVKSQKFRQAVEAVDRTGSGFEIAKTDFPEYLGDNPPRRTLEQVIKDSDDAISEINKVLKESEDLIAKKK